MNTLKESVEVVADPWKQSTYYDDAEKWTIIFWSEDHPFYPLFKRLDLTAVLDWLAVMAAIPRSLPSVLDNLLSWMFTRRT
jgi:hypothetical protein